VTNLIELAIADIRVTRRREREDLGDIDNLAISIARFGQLQPIVVDDNNELIAGERRLTARQQNGDTHILAIRKSDVDEVLAKEMELEENLARKQMTWPEQVRGLAELDRLRRIKNPNWTQVQTAIAAGGNTSQRDVSTAIKLTRMMEVFPELATAKTMSKALKMAEQKAVNIARVDHVKANPQDFADIESRIILGDSVEVIKTIPDESFHAIITDPPFGVDYNERAGDSASNVSGYEDDKEATAHDGP
jgi:ParB family chromosome partitioning protein